MTKNFIDVPSGLSCENLTAISLALTIAAFSSLKNYIMDPIKLEALEEYRR